MCNELFVAHFGIVVDLEAEVAKSRAQDVNFRIDESHEVVGSLTALAIAAAVCLHVDHGWRATDSQWRAGCFTQGLRTASEVTDHAM